MLRRANVRILLPTARPLAVAVRHHGSAPIDPNASKYKYYAQMAWEGLRHLVHGFRLFFLNTHLAWTYARRLSRGVALTRRERALLERATGDLLRLVPFSFFIIIPFAELLLPVALKMFPELIPSTFETEAQGKSKAFQKAAATRLARKRMLEFMTTQALHFPGDQSAISDVLRRAACGDAVSFEQVKLIAPLCSKDGPLSVQRLPPEVLFALARTVDAWRGWYSFVPRKVAAPRVRDAIISHYRRMRQDDNMLREEGISDLTSEELVKANFARGMRWTEKDATLKKQLEVWLKVASDPRVSYNTLFWIKPTAHALRRTMMELPSESRRQLLGISNLPQSVRESLERVIDHVSEAREGPSAKADDADSIVDLIRQRKEEFRKAGSALNEEQVCKDLAEYLTDDVIDALFLEIGAARGGKVRVIDVIEYLAADIHHSSHVVSIVFDTLEMGSGNTIMTPTMLQSVAARCRSGAKKVEAKK